MRRFCIFAVGILAVCALILGGMADSAFAAPKYKWPRALNITAPSKGPKYYAPLAFAGKKTASAIFILYGQNFENFTAAQ